MRLLLVVITAIAVAAPVAGAETRSVTIKNIDFSKRTVRIAKGDSVRWLFRDGSTPHNVISKGAKRFRSSASMSSGTHTVRFTKTGTYNYLCTIHPSMVGKVIVS